MSRKIKEERRHHSEEEKKMKYAHPSYKYVAIPKAVYPDGN